MGFFSDLINTPKLITSVNSPINSASAVQSDRAWAERQARAQMEFQREMANTAYQRAVADMKKAGLNPALSYYHGGAAVPGGSLASTPATSTSTALAREDNLYNAYNNNMRVSGGLVETGIKVIGNLINSAINLFGNFKLKSLLK